MKYLLVVSLILAPFIIKAQHEVILTNGEKLEGKIIIQLPDENFEEIVIKTSEGRTRLRAHEFTQFTYKSALYKPKKYAGKYRIMKVISEDFLSKYEYRENLYYEFNTICLVKADGDAFGVPNLNFSNSLANFLYECPELSQALRDKKYRSNDIDEIIQKYNKCIADVTLQKQVVLENKSVKKEITNEESQIVTVLERLISKTDKNDTDLNSLLDDMLSKVDNGKTVPTYLKSALEDMQSDYPEINEDIEALLKLLNE